MFNLVHQLIYGDAVRPLPLSDRWNLLPLLLVWQVSYGTGSTLVPRGTCQEYGYIPATAFTASAAE